MDIMNSEQNMINTEPHQDIQDDSGLAEIQHALDEIEKLKNDEVEKKTDEESEEREEIKEEDTSEEESQKQEKREKKLWKETKRKYQAIAEKEALVQENAHLKQMLNESLNSGTYHYSKSAYFDLERAKENKKRAIEEGNLDALLDADIALTKAVSTINDLEKWAYNDQQTKAKSSEYDRENQIVNPVHGEREQEIANDWLEDHPYLQPASPKYNSKIANQVANFINHLDTNLANNNQMGAYFSDDYFNTIENYITEIKKESQKVPKDIGSVASVGGVRNSYASSGNGKSSGTTQLILTADEKRMCANAGINEKDWLRYKLEDLKKGK